MTAARSVAAWTGPALVAVLAAQVFAGDPLSPLLTLLVALAPLLALARARDAALASPAHAALALPGLACLVAANAVLVADLARWHGLPRWVAPAAVLLLAVVPLVATNAAMWGATTGLGLLAVAAPVVTVALVTATPPWTAWGQVASRPALVFGERSEWVTDGGRLRSPTTLTFEEPHRVTAVTPALWRVTERDGARSTTRERRLGVGEVVMLRPGDRLTVDAGARLRFESGKRVPGASVSGVAWADPGDRRGLRGMLGALALTAGLFGAALALVPPVRGVGTLAALATTAMPVVLAAVSACTGVYAMYVAPEIALGRGLAAPLHDLPGALLGRLGAAPLVALVGVATLALFSASCAALAARVHHALLGAAPRGAGRWWRGVWVAIAVAGTAATVPALDGARWLTLGVGLLASTWSAPALAAAPPRATVVGAAMGAAIFVVGTVLGAFQAGGVLGDYPVLVAAPAAWTVATALGRGGGDVEEA